MSTKLTRRGTRYNPSPEEKLAHRRQKNKESAARFYREHKIEINEKRKKTYHKNKGHKTPKKRDHFTREENIAEQIALQSKRVTLNPVQLSRLSGLKLVEAVNEMLKNE